MPDEGRVLCYFPDIKQVFKNVLGGVGEKDSYCLHINIFAIRKYVKVPFGIFKHFMPLRMNSLVMVEFCERFKKNLLI